MDSPDQVLPSPPSTNRPPICPLTNLFTVASSPSQRPPPPSHPQPANPPRHTTTTQPVTTRPANATATPPPTAARATPSTPYRSPPPPSPPQQSAPLPPLVSAPAHSPRSVLREKPQRLLVPAGDLSILAAWLRAQRRLRRGKVLRMGV